MNNDKITELLGKRPFELPGDGSLLCCNSRGYILTTKCDKCQHDIDFILWVIVDGEKRPDLLQQITDGILHDPKCPNCDYINHLEADLLLFRPTKEPVLFFSPARGRNSEEQMKVGRSFLSKLKDQLGAAWNNEWYEKDGKLAMLVVNRKVLPRKILVADPICFVSYSWDTAEHREWVRCFATELERNGIYTLLDQWDLKPGLDLLKYMEESITNSDYVILICTPLYAQKANDREGGVGWENTVISGEMFNSVSKETKFVPILKSGTKENAIPSYLTGKVYIDFVKNDFFQSSMEKLLRHIFDSPEYIRPDRGSKPTFADASVFSIGDKRKRLIIQANDYLLKGVKYANKGQYSEAINEYKKAQKIFPEYAETYHNIGVVYSLKRQSNKAIKMFRKAIKVNPNNAVSHNSLGVEFQKNRKYAEAINEYRLALKINPHFVLAYNNLAGVFTIIGADDEAKKACDRALEINPNDVLTRLNLGGIYFNKSMYQEAFMQIAEVLRIDPDNKFVYFQIGVVSHAIGDYEQAERALVKFITDPDPSFLNNVAIAQQLIQKIRSNRSP